MKNIIFECTKLPAGKKGVLKANSDGSYDIVVGALNVFNSVGEFYTAEAAKELFEESSTFMRRTTAGRNKGEDEHPMPNPGESLDQFKARARAIRMDRVCCTHRNFKLDFDNYKDNHNRIAIISNLVPSGPRGEYLEQALNQAGEDVCFSIRSFTNNRVVSGVVHREITEIITFDRVIEPGISIASKYNSLGLENYTESNDFNQSRAEVLTTLEYSKEDILKTGSTLQQAGFESVQISNDAIFKMMGWEMDPKVNNFLREWANS